MPLHPAWRVETSQCTVGLLDSLKLYPNHYTEVLRLHWDSEVLIQFRLARWISWRRYSTHNITHHHSDLLARGSFPAPLYPNTNLNSWHEADRVNGFIQLMPNSDATISRNRDSFFPAMFSGLCVIREAALICLGVLLCPSVMETLYLKYIFKGMQISNMRESTCWQQRHLHWCLWHWFLLVFFLI